MKGKQMIVKKQISIKLQVLSKEEKSNKGQKKLNRCETVVFEVRLKKKISNRKNRSKNSPEKNESDRQHGGR